MRGSLPPVVSTLLAASDPAGAEHAWAEFSAEYSRLLLHVARELGGSQDAVLDRYTYVLEQLRRDDLRRLRGYAADGRGKFTTWLVVVVRRLCIDHERRRTGRHVADDARSQRRALADLAGNAVDVDTLPLPVGPEAEERVHTREVREQVATALSALDPRDRQLLRLRFHEELPVAEIARRLAFPSVFHVYRRLDHLFKQLRDPLRRLWLEDGRG